ncbi:MAG: hypothetical protein ACFFDY_12145 [Candidatus Thorarchaeota archaeon]
MLDLILDTKINPVLLSSFVGALGLFGENLGKIEEINIKGLDVDMIVVYKYNLIFVAILDKEFVKHDIRPEAEKSLDMFYSLYHKEIDENCNEVSQFTSFKNILFTQIEQYFNRIKEETEVKNFGFFTDAIKKLRSNSTN